MTDNEIVKAWEKVVATGDAPIGEHWGCLVTTKLAKETLDTLKIQQEMINGLIAGQETLQKGMAERDKEIERLKNAGDNKTKEILRHISAIEELHEKIKIAKSEAYTELVDKLIDAINKDISLYGNCTVHNMALKINNLLKEMEGETDGTR